MGKSKLSEKKEEIEALVKRVQKGDQEAFSALYDLFIDPIYRYVYFRVKSRDAEDIVETVFVKVWTNIKKYKARKKQLFSAWVFKIAHNLVVDYYRKAKDKNFDELKIDVVDSKREHNPIRTTERSLNSGLLKKAISTLKKPYQDVVVYKFINQLSNSEIAGIMKKSEGSVRILQFRALKALKAELEYLGLKNKN